MQGGTAVVRPHDASVGASPLKCSSEHILIWLSKQRSAEADVEDTKHAASFFYCLLAPLLPLPSEAVSAPEGSKGRWACFSVNVAGVMQ